MLVKLKNSFRPFLFLVFFSLLAMRFLFLPGFWENHDQLAPIRLWQMETCFLDGQIPCRWTPDLGGGFGLPLFNFYAPFFYLLALVPRIFGFSLVASLKITIIILVFFSSFSIYLLLREFLGKISSLIGASFYILAPFHALEIFVRGDLAEAAAFLIVPFVFWSFYRLSQERKWKYFFSSVLSLAAFLLSHNIQVAIFMPLILVWSIFCFRKTKAKKNIVLALIFGFGLASFFLIPAWFEKNLVQIDTLTQGYFDFRAHFVGLKQLFLKRNWGYGASIYGVEEDFSLQLGWPQWWLIVLIPLVFGASKKKFKKIFGILLFFWLVSLFLMTNRSLFIWEKISLMKFFQFPWRFLGVTNFLTAALSALILELLIFQKKKLGVIMALALLVLNFGFNLDYFKPNKTFIIDDNKVKGEFWQQERWASVFDYLPKDVQELPSLDESLPKVGRFFKKSDYFEVEVESCSEEKQELMIPIFNFPHWEVFIDQHLKIVDYLEQAELWSNPQGLIIVKLGKGRHQVTGWLRDTRVREIANFISLLSLFGFSFYLVNWGRW